MQFVEERYGYSNIGLENLEELYNPAVTGIFDMVSNRRHLMEKGMTADFADLLAKRYITKAEVCKELNGNAHVCSIMDLFNTKDNKA